MLPTPKRLQLLVVLLATVALLLPSVSFSYSAPLSNPPLLQGRGNEYPPLLQGREDSATAAIDLSAPHCSGELLVRLKPEAMTAAAFARDRAAMSDRATEFALGLHPDASNGLAPLTAHSVALRDLFARVGASSGYQLWPGTTVYKLNLAASADLAATIAALQADPHVAAVQPNYVYTVNSISGSPAAAPPADPQSMPNAAGAPNDPIYPQQWAIPQILADQAWNISTGKDLTIAFLDTGVSAGHPDLAGKIVEGYNFINNTNRPDDDFGHGTYTAGIAAADSNNGIGIAGVCWGCKVMALKVLGADGSGDSSGFVRALHYAADKGVRVISISAGDEQRDADLGDAVDYAWNKGAFIVASSGNKPDGKPNYPAGYNNVMAVGATARQDAYTGFSSFGPYVDITAPGVGIWSTAWQNGRDTYIAENGTSASCPFVAGVAGLMFSVNPNLSNQQIRDLLLNSADDVGTRGWDEHYGNGRLNALRALQFAQDPGAHQAHASLNLSANSLPAGSAITINGSGFNTGESIEVYFVYADGHRKNLSIVTADGGGNFSLNTTLPSDVPPNNEPEDYAVRAYGQASRRDAYSSITILAGGPIGGPTPTQPVQVATPGPAATPTLPTAPGPRPTALNAVADPRQAGVAFLAPTGHTLREPFLSYWQQHGGLAQFGYPLTEPFSEVSKTDGKTYTVQYFERNRFEFHPENPAGQQVLLGLLGVTLSNGRSFPVSQAFPSTADYAYFPQTQHSLGNGSGFLKYWQQHGGLAIYGYPISEELIENGYTVQYFERNRFEYHPEFADPYKVSLGLLGSELLRDFGWIQ
jgi:Subtilase family